MRQIRQAGTINLHLGSSSRSQCAQHVNFIVYHWAPVRNYPRVWRGGGGRKSVCRVREWVAVGRRGGVRVGHALVALTYIPEVAGTCRWLLLPRPRSWASLQCAHPRKPSTSIDRAEHFSTNGKKQNRCQKIAAAHFVPGSEEREISSTQGINRPHPLVPVCC